MSDFDERVVLETILRENPILSNRRREIVVDGQVRVIYAFYSASIVDPDLIYDVEKRPIETTPESTICEIYSFWKEREMSAEEMRDLKKVRRSGIFSGVTFCKGNRLYCSPDISAWGINYDNEGKFRMNPASSLRKGSILTFANSSIKFGIHFNKICEDNEFDVKLVDKYTGENREGDVIIHGPPRIVPFHISTPISVKLGLGQDSLGVFEKKVEAIVPIGIDLILEDPRLIDVLTEIRKAYDRAKAEKADFVHADLRAYFRDNS